MSTRSPGSAEPTATDPTATDPTHRHLDEEPDVESIVGTLPCVLYGYVRWPDGRNRFVYMSEQSETLFGYPPEPILEDPTLLWGMVHPDDLDRLRAEDEEANRSGSPFQSEVRIQLPSGQEKWIQLSSMPSPQRYEGQVLWSGVVIDVTRRRRVDEERNRLVEELRTALARIRKLEGIIPICGYCRKVRTQGDAWEQLDAYVRRHSDADFSHGICPQCQARHFPDL